MFFPHALRVCVRGFACPLHFHIIILVWTPLVIAAQKGHLTVVTKLIAAGALVDKMLTTTDSPHPTLHAARVWPPHRGDEAHRSWRRRQQGATRSGITPLCIAADTAAPPSSRSCCSTARTSRSEAEQYGTPLEAVEFMEASTRHKNHAAIVALLA